MWLRGRALASGPEFNPQIYRKEGRRGREKAREKLSER